MPPLHPLAVHAPIVLLPLAAVTTLLARRREHLAASSAAFTYLAAAAALVATVLGLVDHEPYEQTVAHAAIETHELFAFVTLGLAALASGWRFLGRRRGSDPVKSPLFLALLATASTVVLGAGLSGGRLVFDQAVGVQGGKHVPAGGEK